jgi:hypothetical protein
MSGFEYQPSQARYDRFIAGDSHVLGEEHGDVTVMPGCHPFVSEVDGPLGPRHYALDGRVPPSPRGTRQPAAPTGADGPPALVPARPLAPTEASRRWATLLQPLFDVDPLACPTGHGTMRSVAVITQTSVSDQILTHLRTRAAREAHAGPRRPATSRGRSVRAAIPPARPMGPRRPPRGAGEVGNRALCLTDSRPTPIEIPVPHKTTSPRENRGAVKDGP